MSLLLKNANVIDENFNCIENAYLGIENNIIDYIGKERPVKKYTEEKDMTSKVVMPGFVNSHSHAPMVLLRGIGSNLPLQQWLNKMFAIEDKLTDEVVIAGTKLAMLEMLACGTTSFTDMYMFENNVAQVAGECGIKANVTRCFCGGFNNEEYRTSFRRKEAFDLFDQYNGSFDGRVLVDYSIHAEYTITKDFIQQWADELKDRREVRGQIHLSETKKEHDECIAKYGKTPARLCYDCGLFDFPTMAAHCVWVSDEDLEIMKEKKVSVAHCPESNLKLGSGVANVRKMLEKGILVGIGTDGAASNNNLNVMEEMHLASILHEGMKASQILKMATLNGALIQGRKDTGVLQEGKKADLIAISLDKPHMHPNLDTVALVCYSAQASDVCMTMVDGKILYEDGEYKTLDKEKIVYEAEKAVEKLYS